MVKVIIAITTYNLEEYVAQALDSVLMQKTNFDFKIRIADDCSTDNTIDILKDYQHRFPQIIEVLFSDKNMGSLANSNRLLDNIDCEYFSFLDGDDYWVGERRLQEQVDFLDSHPEYTMCGGNTQLLRDGRLGELMLDNRMLGKSLFFDDYFQGKMPCVVHTSSILLRNIIFKKGLPCCYKTVLGTYEECAVRGEDFRRLIHLEKGPIFVEDKVLSVYRIHDRGTWQGASILRLLLENTISFNFYIKYFGDRHRAYFQDQLNNSYRNLMSYLLSNKSITRSNKLPNKDAILFGGLMRDLAIDNLLSDPPKFHRWRFHFVKLLIRIGII